MPTEQEFHDAYDNAMYQMGRAIIMIAQTMTKEQMKDVFRNRNEKDLKYILERIATKEEMYEICQVIKDVLDEKK